MEPIRNYLKSDCYSFTILILINAILAKAGVVEDIKISASIQFFVITSTIAVLMYFTDWFLIHKRGVIQRFFHIVDIVISIFVWGLVFNYLSFSYKEWIITAIICICTYSLVSVIMALDNKRHADDINESLKRMRLKNKQ